MNMDKGDGADDRRKVVQLFHITSAKIRKIFLIHVLFGTLF